MVHRRPFFATVATIDKNNTIIYEPDDQSKCTVNEWDWKIINELVKFVTDTNNSRL